MAISKSTPYVRYKENFTSNLHLGTIHVESEYLDRTQKTTIESIHGMTWHNKVVNENKELDLLSNLGFELTESKKEYFNVGEQRVSVDEIHGMQDIEPNEDGTYTYSVTSIEGEYAEIYDGLNHITSTSDGLDGNFEIVYDTDEEDITGSVVLDATMPNYTIEDSNVGELNDVVFKGETLVNILPQPSLRNKMENTSMQRLNEGHDEVVVVDGEYKSAILKGNTRKNEVIKNEEKKVTITSSTTSNSTISYSITGLENNTVYWFSVDVVTNTCVGTSSTATSSIIYIANGEPFKDYTQLKNANGEGLLAGATGRYFAKVKTATNITNKKQVLFYLGRQIGAGTIIFKNPFICKTVTGEELPPYFEGIGAVKMPVLTTTNRINVFIENKEFSRGFYNGESAVKASHDYMDGYICDVEPNTTYSLYFKDGEPDTNKITHVSFWNENTYISGWKTNPITFTTPANCNKLRFAYDRRATNINPLFIPSNIVLSIGTGVVYDESFKSNILTCNEEVQLRGIGDVKDELNLLTGELTQCIGEIVLDGSEDITDQTTDTINHTRVMFKFPQPMMLYGKSICSHTPIRLLEPHGEWEYYMMLHDVVYLQLSNSKLETPNVDGVRKYMAQQYQLGTPITIHYQLAEKVVKTVDLTVTDQDNVVLETGKPRSYKDGHIQVQSNGILPSSISYEVPSQNHMYVDMLKPSNTYTLKRNGENFEGSFFIDGTEYNTNVFMTSHQLPNKSLIINDMSEHDKVAMFEGNYGTSTIPYFEGMTSVKMPVLKTTGKNLFDVSRHGSLTPQPTGDIQLNSAEWGKYDVKYILKPNTQYTLTILGDGTKCWIAIFVDGSSESSNVETSYTKTFSTNSNGEVTIGIYANSDKYVGYSRKSISIEEGTVSTPYEPFKSNILTVNEPVELRAIGDVKDEYNVETGELTQRIGEIVLDGSENWRIQNTTTTNTVRYCVDDVVKNAKPISEDGGVCDKIPYGKIYDLDEIGVVLTAASGHCYIRSTIRDLSEFKTWLQSNPLTVQYQLAQPTTRKVISTILDQDGKQTHSMSTYTGLTNLSTSSDTLIPNVNLDYEISSSTGTVTGTSATIENGENGSPISAIVYGESLVNVIQEPSDVECVVLGEHSGNNITIENSVEGNIENAVIKGMTLVNLSHQKDAVERAQNMAVEMCKDGKISRGKKYLFIVNFEKVNDVKKIKFEARNNGTWVADLKWVKINLGLNKYIIDIPEDKEVNSLKLTNPDTSTESIIVKEFILLEYQEGMENWDIPYFEGMGSVKQPVLTTTGKNLFNKNNIIVDGYIVADGRVITQLNDNRNATDYIEVLPDTIYTMSGVKNSGIGGGNTTQYVAFYDKNKEYLTYAHVNVASDKFSITTSSETIYIRMSVRNADIDRLQIEKGTTVTTYEPHKSNTVTCNEEVELRGIGDVKDELDLVTGKLTQRIGEVVLDGDEAWVINGTFDTVVRAFCLRAKTFSDIKNAHCGISDSLPSYLYGNGSEVSGNSDIEGLFHTNDETYIRILKTKLTSLDVKGLCEYLSRNPIKVQYELATPIIKTIDLTVTDQDGNPTSLHSYNGTTHIITNSQGLIANVEISNPSYDVVLKTNTKYTLKLNRTNTPTNTPLEINLGGTEATMDSTVNSIAITTPSTLANNKLTMNGVGNKFKEAMVIEGDCVDRDLDYFEGIVGVENPIVSTISKNLMPTMDKNNPDEYGTLSGNGTTSFKYNHEVGGFYTDVHRNIFAKGIIGLKPNTTYTISVDVLRNPNGGATNDYGFLWQNPTKLMVAIDKISTTEWKRFSTQRTTDNNGKFQGTCTVYRGLYFRNIQIEEGIVETTYEPYQGNILTTYPQITLHSIGNIKDELDLVNETVTRRIGEVVLNGSEKWEIREFNTTNTECAIFTINIDDKLHNWYYNCDKFKYTGTDIILANNIEGIYAGGKSYSFFINVSKTKASTVEEFKNWLSNNNVTVQYELIEPITESVRITPPNPQTSTANVTLSTQLGESDYVTWNPYKEHYVHYNYEQDGSYTWDNLTDLNERQFIELYDRRTYVEQEYKNTFLSHDSKGTSKYVLIEPNQDYTVTVRFSELPQCETVKVNLGGSEVEMNVSDPRVHVTTPSTLSNYLCSISGKGLSGKITDILVIHCLEHEGFADIDYFEGIDSIGEVVEVDGVSKSKIVIEQTNGNLLDFEPTIHNSGNYISMAWSENVRNIPLRPNKNYVVKFPRPEYTLGTTSWADYSVRTYDENLTQIRTISKNSDILRRHPFTTQSNEKYLRFHGQYSEKGSANVHIPVELCYAEFEKDEAIIRPRYYDKEEIILPIQLCRINTVYDNFYYDVIRGHYRIQQSIGHKYFTGADSENWTLIERGQRILRFRYNNADIQIKSLGEYMTNRFTNGTATSPYESCAFNGTTFIISIDKERLSNATLAAFKEWLSSHNVHLYYQLASPMMIDLPQYSSKLELNTYKDEIYTFLKNCKPTVFTLDVPLDQTYRFYELQESQGYTNRIELTDERMTEEDTLYINTIYGSGISNLIEEPNNVNTLLKPNYEGRATSHTLTNGKVSTISVHGFEPNDVTINNYNTVTKQYELTVQAQKGTNTNTKVLPIPYKFEVYEDGTKDRVYYNSQYKQWMFEGGQTLMVAYNSSTGVFTNAIEIFRGMTPRSGMIGEFKVKFASGTTSARLYYSLDGSTYTYTTLRSMTDGVEYYIAFFNTGGTKIDMATKIGADSEYTTLVPLSGAMTEALMINQIQGITECTYYQDKTYYYSDVVSPLVLDVYNGETIITELNGAVIDIQNNAHNKQALIYANTPYTVYWTYVGGQGNIKVTLGGATQEVVATQGYVTITTSDADLEKGLLIGGFDVTIKDLMLIKGERIADLSYFEGSRAVGTAFIDEDGNTMYKVTLVTGSELIQDKFEDVITFEDNKKHNVLVTKLLGTKPNKN